MCTLGSDCVRSPLPSLVTIDGGAGLGDQEIGAGDADIGGEEFLAQDLARLGDQLRGLDQLRGPPAACVCRRRKSASTWSWVQVDGGRDDVARRLAADLDEVFAEVGLDHLEAVAFQARR